MNVSNIARVTATGDVTTADSYLRAVTLTSGAAAAAVLTVRAGGSGGTVIVTLKCGSATLAESVPFDLGAGVFCADGIHATLSGSGAEASFVYV